MKTEVKALIDNQNKGKKLNKSEIRMLMEYALEMLREFGRLTQASIDRAKKILTKD